MMPEASADPYALLWALRYDDAVEAARQRLDLAPNDLEAIDVMAHGLLATRKYEEAIPYFSRLDEIERADVVAPGQMGQRLTLACISWMLGESAAARASMRSLVEGILDRSIQYADGAGGVTQGTLLYYMAVTTHDVLDAELAVKYLRGRTKRMAIQSWPGPLALYYLDQVDFSFVLEAATGERDFDRAVDEANANLRKRRDLCVALFHDGVRERSLGREEKCLERMRQCCALRNPIIEDEWYLARYELDQAGNV